MCWKTGDNTDSLDFFFFVCLVWYFIPQSDTDSLWYSLCCEFKILLLLLFESGNKSFINTGKLNLHPGRSVSSF